MECHHPQRYDFQFLKKPYPENHKYKIFLPKIYRARRCNNATGHCGIVSSVFITFIVNSIPKPDKPSK